MDIWSSTGGYGYIKCNSPIQTIKFTILITKPHLFIVSFSSLTDFQAISSIDCITCVYTVYIDYVRRKALAQRLKTRRRAKLGESKIATKLVKKTLYNASIVLKRGDHTYSRLFHRFNLYNFTCLKSHFTQA